MTYPKDEDIIKKFIQVSSEYGKGDNWNLRITADELNCPISYVRNVLAEHEEEL